MLLNALVAALLFFLFANPLEEAAINPVSDGGYELQFQEGISVPLLDISEPPEELLEGNRIFMMIELESADFSVLTRRSIAELSYSVHQMDRHPYRSLVLLGTDPVTAYIEQLVSTEDFYLLRLDRNGSVLRSAIFVKVTDCDRMLMVNLWQEHAAAVSAAVDEPDQRTAVSFDEWQHLYDITIRYTLFDPSFFGMPFTRAVAVDTFLSDYGLDAGSVLAEHEGINFDAITAYLETVGSTLDEMSSEEISEFGSELRSFIWGLILMSLTVVGPLTLIAVVRYVQGILWAKKTIERKRQKKRKSGQKRR